MLSCVDCHKGDNTKPNNMEEAHQGLVVFPSRYDESGKNICGNINCHPNTVEMFRNSLHNQLWGYQVNIAQRAGVQSFEQCPQSLKDGFKNECRSCHASCGDCHVAKPNSVGKGFISSHRFNKMPDQTNQCLACHGARIGHDFLGDYDRFPPRERDIHSTRFKCIDCHGKEKLHASALETDTRYTHANQASCVDENCHAAGLSGANPYHGRHMSDLSCYVCHSTGTYTNCAGCHVDGAYKKDPVYQANNPAEDFRIGLNPIKSSTRPFKFAVLRHIPVVPTTYDNWGAAGTLVAYDQYPTWKYTSPHSIRRWTARTDTTGGKRCTESCHIGGAFGKEANKKYYLFREYVQSNWPDEVQANESVVVDGKLPAGWE